ncbi:putative reverse transcriptase domain-containing protein [Tanacetum coccineum]
MIGTATGLKVKPTSSPTLLLTFSSIIFRIGVKIVWTLVWDFGCNNWRLCVVFLDGTSLKVGDGRKEGQGGQVGGQGVQVGGQGSEVNDGIGGVPNFSTIIAQQFQNLLPTIVAQVGDQGRGQGNGRNQNSNAANDNIRGDVSRGCTYKEFLACNPKEYDGKGGMSWEDFKTLTREEFCSSNEMQKLETELWNHAMVGAGHAAYTDRFHELARNGGNNGAKDHPKGGCADCWHTNCEAIGNGSNRKEPEKERKLGRKPSKGIGMEDYRVVPRNVNPINARNHTARDVTEWVVPDHVKSACPREFMLGAKEARQDPNIVTGMFTLNNHYATTLFDSGADYSFVSTTFIPLLGIESYDLGFSYEIEIASGQLVEINKVIKGCKLEIESHVFDINLIPFGSGSFDMIKGLD